MYSALIEQVNRGEFAEAAVELEKYRVEEYDEQLAAIAGTVFWETGNLTDAYKAVRQGLLCNPESSELYLELGQLYSLENINMAYLCYENAELFCQDEKDREIILQFKTAAMQQASWRVRKTSIVILSYNSVELTKACVESIQRHNLSSAYEIIVVDNASMDGSVEWLKTRKDIKVIYNQENKGFPFGCNQGVEFADAEADIFFLNNDTLLYRNSLFWLRMALYSDEKIGAAGSVTNYAGNLQGIPCTCSEDEEYERFANQMNMLMDRPYEEKLYLIGFALLVNRECLNEIGMFDLRFSPGQFEDNDLGLRICQSGRKNLLCHNSFIRHYGHGNGENIEFWDKGWKRNAEMLDDKWGFPVSYYMKTRKELIDYIHRSENEAFSVLEIGCGMGATLARIKYLFPHSRLKGIELVPEAVRIGSNILDIAQGDIERSVFPFEDYRFDYIILGDVLEHLHNPQEVLVRLSRYLADDGKFICSIPNMMHVSVLYPLLQGDFAYQEAGLLDGTHLRWFTLSSIHSLFDQVGFVLEEMKCSHDGSENIPEYVEFIDWLMTNPNHSGRIQYTTYQYLFCAGKRLEHT